ncbi:hypothetical protein NMY22_g16331 [Coprinellus aureogranulatus]|nr:hypothetical protein NMY22_g16331 [Coprinellus aureogranulatus]
MNGSEPDTDTMSLDTAIEQAKRAFALQKYEQAVELYTVALEKLTQEVKDDAPELADLYFLYGKALLENAISQAGVLGKDQPATADDDEGDEVALTLTLIPFKCITYNVASTSKGPHRPILSFSGDGDDDPTIDLLNAPLDDSDSSDREQGGEGDQDDDEPEDDFNAAWEILELAKAIYQKQLKSGGSDSDEEETQLKLADVTKENQTLKGRLREMEKSMEQLLLSSRDTGRVEQLQRENRELKLHIQDLEQVSAQLQSQHEDSQVQQLQHVLGVVSRENDGMKVRIREMQAGVVQMRTEHESRMAEMQRRLDSLTAENAQLKTQLQNSPAPRGHHDEEEDMSVPPPAYDAIPPEIPH